MAITELEKPLEHFTEEEMWIENPDGSMSRSDAYLRALNAHKARQQLIESGVGERYWDVSADKLIKIDPLNRVLSGLGRYHQLKGHNLILTGALGTGKTQAAILILKHALAQGDMGLLQNLGLLAVMVRDGYGATGEDRVTERAAIRRMAEPDVLVLDDLGAGETSNATIEKRLLYLALEQRCNNNLTTVITTNLTVGELVDIYGKRIFNRLQPSTTIEFTGKNWRLEQDKEGW